MKFAPAMTGMWIVAATALSAAPAGGGGPAEKPVEPFEELRREAGRQAARMRRELGEGFIVLEDAPFVIGGNLSATRLEALRRDTVRRSATALWATFFDKKPNRVLRIYVFADEAGYRAGAKRLFGDENVSRFGYFRPSEGVLVMDISTGGGTLVHELTHALMRPDFPEVPDWFNEGLASLFEQCRFEESRLVGLVNWRLPILKRAMAAGRLPALKTLLSGAGGFYGSGAGENYALARYLCLYLQSKGVLVKFYKAFRDGVAEDATGARQLVEALGARDLEAVERDFLQWVEGLATEG